MLRDYQAEFVQAAIEMIAEHEDGKYAEKPHSGGLIEAATGTGKSLQLTAIADYAIKEGYTVLSLVHNLILNEQNKEQIIRFSDLSEDEILPLRGKIDKAANKDGNKRLFYANPLSFFNRLGKRRGVLAEKRREEVYGAIKISPKKNHIVILLDEAHYGAASEARKLEFILKEFHDKGIKTTLIGLTATPFVYKPISAILRSNLRRAAEQDYLSDEERKKLKAIIGRPPLRSLVDGKIFHKRLGRPYTIERGIKDGWLSPLTVSPLSLAELSAQKRWLQEKLTGEDELTGGQDFALMKDNERAVLDALAVIGAQDQALVFVSSIAGATWLARVGRKFGLDIDCITSAGTSPNEESEVLARFKAGKLRLLVNVDKMTTGFDYPNLRQIALLRSIRSKTALTQILGRGTRIAEGKETCLIYDLMDNIKDYSEPDGKGGELSGMSAILNPVSASGWSDSHYEEFIKAQLKLARKCACGLEYYPRQSFKCECGREVRFIRANAWENYPWHFFRRYYEGLGYEFPIAEGDEADNGSWGERWDTVFNVAREIRHSRAMAEADGADPDMASKSLINVSDRGSLAAASMILKCAENPQGDFFIENTMRCEAAGGGVDGEADFIVPSAKCPICDKPHIERGIRCPDMNMAYIPLKAQTSLNLSGIRESSAKRDSWLKVEAISEFGAQEFSTPRAGKVRYVRMKVKAAGYTGKNTYCAFLHPFDSAWTDFSLMKAEGFLSEAAQYGAFTKQITDNPQAVDKRLQELIAKEELYCRIYEKSSGKYSVKRIIFKKFRNYA